jgi:hypothetical protein
MPDPYQHIDMTPEYNRIISALTGIRDDIRLIRRRVEDAEMGVVTSQVLNDFERAMLAVSMSAAGANDAERIRQGIESGTGLTGGSGNIAAPSGDDTETREDILLALGITQDFENDDPRSIFRIDGLYYQEAKVTNAPDDGLRGSLPVSSPFIADGGPIGYHALATNTATPGAPPTPPPDVVDYGASRKRWPAPRPENRTAVPNADPNADIVNPVTGNVVPRTIEDVLNDIAADGNAPPPAYTQEDGTGVG